MHQPTYYQNGSFPTEISDNTIISNHFNDIYFSKKNGLKEKKIVFLEPNKIKERLNNSDHFVIGELGFGCGLNFLATWDLFNKFSKTNSVLDYISIEAYPLQIEVLKKVHSLFPEINLLSKKLLSALPPLWPGLHKIHFNSGKISLTIIYGDVFEKLKSLNFLSDAWYFDGFNPKKNPEMWSEDVFKEVKRLTIPGGSFSTFTSSTVVQNNLKKAGFQINLIPGYLNKREMITGSNPGINIKNNLSRKIIVIGGGVAGASVARALKRRNSEVTLVEKHSLLSKGASGNLAAIQSPRIGTVDTIMSRLSIACYRYSRYIANEFKASLGDKSIVLGVIKREIERQEKILSRGWPSDLVRRLNVNDIEYLNLPNNKITGVVHDYGGTIIPQKFVKNLIGDDIEFYLNKNVIEISKSANGWTLFLDNDRKLNSEIIVLCNGEGLKTLNPTKHLNLQYTQGQVTYLDKKNINILPKSNISFGGYITPMIDNKITIGSTFEKYELPRSNLSEDSHVENLTKPPKIIRDKLFKNISKKNYYELDGKVSMRVSAYDRLPLAGKIENNLFILSGLGSKGMVWGPLMGEALACMILNHPIGLEENMLRACDPNRIERFF